jgi:hypothetical protein
MPVMFLEPLRIAVQCTQLACGQCQLMFFAPWLLWAWAPQRREIDDR